MKNGINRDASLSREFFRYRIRRRRVGARRKYNGVGGGGEGGGGDTERRIREARILQSRSGDKGSAREVGEYWLNRPGWCTSVWIFIQAGRKEKKMEEEDRSIARDDGQTCERFLKIVT